MQTEMAPAGNLASSDVPRPLSHFGGGRRDILIETQPKGDTAATVAIASISDQDWYISRTHGVYHVPARAKGEAYALLLITARGDVIDLGDNRRFPFTITAREIADDLLQDLQDHGIFVCTGARPTGEELAGATERRDTYYHRLIGEGDTLWARPFVPGDFGLAPARRDDVGRRTGVGVCPHANERMPGVRRKNQGGRRHLQALSRDSRCRESRATWFGHAHRKSCAQRKQ